MIAALVRRRGGLFFTVTAAALLLVAACTYRGEPSTSIERSVTWFSYIGGEDIRASCRVNGVDRYRFVYNGHYERQIRAYDLTPVPDGAELVARARGRSGDVRRFAPNDLLGPWGLTRSATSLDNTQASQIVRKLADAADSAPSLRGETLRSYEFYWIVSACSQGRFRVLAFRWPETDLDRLGFVMLLLERDDTGIPYAAPRDIEGLQEDSFGVTINEAGTGLVGL